MGWNEEEHPRQEDGKFTFKNGGRGNNENSKNKNQAETLYGKKVKEEKLKKEKRNELLNILKDKATNADILYVSNEELQEKANKLQQYEKATGGASDINSSMGNWQKPVNYTGVSSSYGWRIHPVHKTKKFHSGVDLRIPQGTKIKASIDGVVEFAGEQRGYGYVVIINHGKINGKIVKTKYAHLSKFNVKKGDSIKANSILGSSGGAKGTAGAGTSTGPHLHFEVMENNVPVNPMNYLKH